MKISNILEQNIYDKKFEGRFLIVGSCVPELYPDITDKFKNNWINVFSFCL